MFFFLILAKQGDSYTLETDYDTVAEMKLKNFDTVFPATGVLEAGFRFVACDLSDHGDGPSSARPCRKKKSVLILFVR